MEFPRKSDFCDRHKNVSAQTCDNQECPGANQNICSLCGKRGLSEADEIPVGGNLPDNVCKCFFFCEINTPEVSFAIEQKIESPTIQVSASQNVNLIPVIEVSCVEDTGNNSINNYVSSNNEESKIPEFSLSPSCLHKLSPDRNSTDNRSIESPRSGEYSKTSPNTERGNISSGYALSLHEHSFDQINFTSPSSGGDSKSSNKETSPSSGYAMSLGEQSFDRNFTSHRNITTSPSSGEDLKSSPDVERVKNCARYLDKNNTNSKYKNKTECRSSQSSPSEQGHRNIKQLRAGEPSKSESMAEYANNTYSKQEIKSEYRSGRNSQNVQEHRHNMQLKAKELSNAEPMESNASNKNRQNERGIYTGGKFRSENRNVRFASHRPPLPRPFPSLHPQPHQPYMNPAINISAPSPYLGSFPKQYPQPFHSNGTPATNMPIIRTNVPGRFFIAPRPQASTSYQRPNSEGSGSLSKKSVAQADKMDSGGILIRRNERIKDWIEGIPRDCIPPDDEATLAQCSTDQNEENEGVVPEGPGLPETSTDERSSTEKSEEENRRQRSLRRPPRNNKKR